MSRTALKAAFVLSLAAAVTIAFWSSDSIRDARAHCQVPCGIYDDPARVQQLREDATTIEKAVRQLAELAGRTDPASVNQAVRWVNTKEAHASHIIELVSEYFLAQRVKPVGRESNQYAAYLATLADHHAVMVAAMKTKQVPTLETVAALKKAIEALAVHYRPKCETPAKAPAGKHEHGHSH
jgi:nickel superoxide dismutase